MFKNIEKEYIKILGERKFNWYYWISVIDIGIISVITSQLLNFWLSVALFFGLLFSNVFVYDYCTYKATIRELPKSQKTMASYKICKNSNRINSLLQVLYMNSFTSKEALKIAIDYYNHKQPVKIATNLLTWIFSTAISLNSIIIVIEDKISLNSFSPFISCIIIIVVFLLPFKLLINVLFSKKEMYSQLHEDLCYIYLNFDKYEN